MPSTALTDLSHQIEQQPTDSLGKFYMYAALLQLITMDPDSSKNSSFNGVIPKDTRNLSKAFPGRQTELKIGTLNATFFQQVEEYKVQFKPHTPSEFTAVKKVIQAYFRSGQIGDLVFINEKMLAHLEAIQPSSLSANNSIYSTIGFQNMKVPISGMLKDVKVVHTAMLDCLDNTMGMTASALLAIAGLVVVMVSITALAQVLGAIALLSGVYNAYMYYGELLQAFSRINSAINICHTNTHNIVTKNYIETISDNKLFKDFILDAIVAPLTFSAGTIREQLTATPVQEHDNKEYRRVMTSQFSQFVP